MRVSKKYTDGSFGVTFTQLEVKAIFKNAIREHVRLRTGMKRIGCWVNLDRYTTPVFMKGERSHDVSLTVSGI